jgi:hypothetical protein
MKVRENATHLFKTRKLDSQILCWTFERWLRQFLANENRHDTMLKLWIEIFESAK